MTKRKGFYDKYVNPLGASNINTESDRHGHYVRTVR